MNEDLHFQFEHKDSNKGVTNNQCTMKATFIKSLTNNCVHLIVIPYRIRKIMSICCW